MPWEFSDDGLTLTFRLNPDAKWSNGDPVTASDFVWSLQRSLHPSMGNLLAEFLYPIKNADPYARGLIDDPNQLGVHALDNYTLEIQLETPTPYILQLLSLPAAYPVHRATIEAYGDATARYTHWTRVGNIVFRPIDNSTFEERMFRAGQLHVTNRVPVHKIPVYAAYDDSPYVQATFGRGWLCQR